MHNQQSFAAKCRKVAPQRTQAVQDDGLWTRELAQLVVCWAISSVVLLTISVSASGQEVMRAAAAPQATIEHARKPEPSPPGQTAEAKEEDSKEQDGSKEGEKKDEAKDDKTSSEDESASIKRPSKPPRVPDPREFDVMPDKNGRLRFSFNGQMWPHVLQWVASLGDHSLDWQELPDDYINFTANRDYSLDEVRDLFNRMLFERGYTMILKGDLLLVTKISKLDPSLLPRVDDESALMDMRPHDFVKITFQLPSKLKADKAAEDVKPLLSSHAKVQPLMATNRLLVIDTVANLRHVSHLINAEHAAATGMIVPREFPIRFARADQVADQVMILLGLDPSSRRTPQELQVEQQKIQLFTQMQQKGKDVTKYLRPADAPRVYLAVNPRNNSILANAPAEEMSVIERSIEMLDVRDGALVGATPANLSMEKYPLVTLKAESIVTTLNDIANLDPRTRLQIDSETRTVFAFATNRDHEKIRAMIDQLDGSGRELEVIWLRRLPADAVATTIKNLMVGDDQEDEDDGRRSYFSFYRFRNQESEKPKTEMRVDADIENNRLLLWVNPQELKEVRAFLAKLGEIPGESGNPNRIRVLDARDSESTLRLLEQLRLMWPSIGPNQLRIEGPPPADTDDAKEGPAEPAESVVPTKPSVTQDPRHQSALVQLAWAEDRLTTDRPATGRPDDARTQLGDVRAQSDSQNRQTADPIIITVNEHGQIVMSSRDTQALDQLEDLISRIASPAKDYEVFYLQHALASLVTLNLEEYFEEETEDNSEDAFWRGWYGFDFGSDSKSSGTGLSARRKIRFIYDYDTNSILVSNASPDQLNTVRSLIEIYDKPPSEDSISARRFQIYRIKHARAEDVASTIKDVYRDLLSSKDKVFDKGRGEKEQASQTTNYYRVYGSSDDDKKPKKIRASFSGALSVGVDKTTNTVIVSAQEEWIPSISEMIRFLDQEAEPFKETVQVVNTKNIDAGALRAALSRTFGQPGESRQEDKPQQPKPSDEGEAPEQQRAETRGAGVN